MKKLENRVALVTGSSSGVGAAIAEELASHGVSLIINGRRKEIVESMRQKLEIKYEVKTYPCIADATDNNSIGLALNKIFPNQLDHLDILVNNVGGLEKFGNLSNLNESDWMRAYDLNCMSAVRFSNYCAEWLKKSQYPRIINISSLNTIRVGNFNPHYGCAKVALEYFSKYLAKQLAPWQILVNTVGTSTLDGGEWEQNIQDRANRLNISFQEAEEIMKKEEEKKSPLGRMASTKSIAKVVAFLASGDNRFISGAIITHDGGTTL